MTTRLKLGNGSTVFACCGGTAFHVGSWHKEMDDEHKKSEAFQARWRKSQEERRKALIGAPLISFTADAFGFVAKFEGGASAVGTMTGREMDGHGECSNQSLHVEYRAPGESDAWGVFYDRERQGDLP